MSYKINSTARQGRQPISQCVSSHSSQNLMTKVMSHSEGAAAKSSKTVTSSRSSVECKVKKKIVFGPKMLKKRELMTNLLWKIYKKMTSCCYENNKAKVFQISLLCNK